MLGIHCTGLQQLSSAKSAFGFIETKHVSSNLSEILERTEGCGRSILGMISFTGDDTFRQTQRNHLRETETSKGLHSPAECLPFLLAHVL